jgi:hypothetical protein
MKYENEDDSDEEEELKSSADSTMSGNENITVL